MTETHQEQATVKASKNFNSIIGIQAIQGKSLKDLAQRAQEIETAKDM
jgi:hypothetical protein